MTFLERTLLGTVMILAVAVLRALALRRLPKGTFVALWQLTVLRLLVPAELPSRFSVYTMLEALRPKAVPVPPAAPAVTPYVPAPAAALPGPSGMMPAAPAPFPVWTALWLTGAAALGLWHLVRYVRWRRRFRESLPAGDCPAADACLRSRREIRLRVTDRIGAPLTYGVLRPVILLPKTLDLGDEEAVTCVLAHEMGHIRRLDGLFKLALAAVLCLYWFDPAVWLLYVLANRDMELRCDEAAVLSLGEDSRERYALALIRLAESRNERVPLCGFSHESGMEERIRAIMSIKKRSMPACFIALALVLGITTAFATSAKPMEADRPDLESIPDGDLLAQSSAESAAQWDEVLAPYAPFGLEWDFDDPDLDGNGLAMNWEGHEVRGIYDQENGVWITEHAGDGTFGPDAVELYTVYENGELTGLRLATEEEREAFDRDRKLNADARKVEALAESVRCDSGRIYFTIPESEGRWSIFIRGRVLLEDGTGMSVHYLEEESERAEWVPGETYSFEAADAAFDELTMDIRYGDADLCCPLTRLLPEGEPLAAGALPEGEADIPAGAAMIWPVDGGRITNGFGGRAAPGGKGGTVHGGVDIGGLAAGAPIYAAAAGTAAEAGYDPSLGYYVRLDHGDGLETLYAHCRSLEVEAGDAVALGQTIASVGSTGDSTGPHLHFEILTDGVRQDPERYHRMGGASAGEGTDLSAGGPEGQGEVSALDAERCYEAGSVPLFQIAFSRLDREAQDGWLDRIYADRSIAVLGAVADLLDEDSAPVRRLAGMAYEEGDIASFSVLAAHMSGEALEGWLDRALEDEEWAFESVLSGALGRDSESEGRKEAREAAWDEAQEAAYQAVGITVDGKERYYQGQRINVFLDIRADRSFYTLDVDPAGTVDVKVLRGEDGEIAGAAYMTDAEIAELFGQDR